MSARLRGASSSRTIWVMAAVAVVSLAAGLGLSRLVVSPADAAAKIAPPEAGPITVPVESRSLSNDVSIRGEATYDDPVAVTIESSDRTGPAIVTGVVPEVGTTLAPAAVALEVAGRPVIVLTGALPTYRTLSAGASGPDVRQLKAALAEVGIDVGDSDTYDARTAAGVVALYQKVGYQPPTPAKALAESVTMAQETLVQAQDNLSAAQQALTRAGAGPLRSAVVRLDAAVRLAEQSLAEATTQCSPEALADPANEARCPFQVMEAQAALDVARAERAEADKAPDVSAETAQLAAARRQVADATDALSTARTETLTTLPASEVVFLPSLPRRVDEVRVTRGATIEGPVMTVSGAKLEIVASASKKDADLLTVGSTGMITITGTDYPLTVTSIEEAKANGTGTGASTGGTSSGGAATHYTITMSPGVLTEEQVTALQGASGRVRIQVSSTGTDVLAVPLAALTAGPSGESRVEVVRAGGTSELVTVETGLAAGGYVQITSAKVPLAAGDLVVVGAKTKAGAKGTSTSGPKDGATSEESPDDAATDGATDGDGS